MTQKDASVPDGDLFKNSNPALRTGLLSLGPCGTDFSNQRRRIQRVPVSERDDIGRGAQIIGLVEGAIPRRRQK
jgi:hypothetical protein